MFENKLKKISKEIFKDKNLQKYFILTHKKHKREMYFRVGDQKALNFAKSKFNSNKKRIIFFLLKINFLQLFLKKINLSKELGNLVFVAGQIKAFDLEKNRVKSFHHIEGSKESFLKDKLDQKKISQKGFAPIISKIDKKNIFSEEELHSSYQGGIKPLFKKLISFYNPHIRKNNYLYELLYTFYLNFERELNK
jgi:GH15 family glucan-1,4-alpha-glucosidase